MPDTWKRRHAAWIFLRDILLFFGGMAGAAVETVAYLEGISVEPTLLILFATMMGLPFVLSGPKRNGNGNGNGR